MKRLLLTLITITLTYATFAQPGRGRPVHRDLHFRNSGHPAAGELFIHSIGPPDLKIVINGKPVNRIATRSLGLRVRPGNHHLVIFARGPRGRIQRIRKRIHVRPGEFVNLQVKFHRRYGLVVQEGYYQDPHQRRGRLYDHYYNW